MKNFPSFHYFTPEPNLSRCMRHLNGVYTQRCNRCHGRGGHLLLAVAELLSEFSRTAPTAITPPICWLLIRMQMLDCKT